MAGGRNIDNVFIQSFEQHVRHLAQQEQSKLRGTTMERSVNSEKHNWETLDFSDAVAKTASAPPTPNVDLPFGRRVSIAQTRHNGAVVDNEDEVQLLIEPKSSSSENLARSMNRAIDDIIISNALADATIGDGTTVTFPTSQRIGDGTAPISFDAITEVQERFMLNDVDPSVPKCAVVGPTQVRKLLSLTEQTSTDYARVGADRTALQNLNASGIVPMWMGFTWIMSTRLEAPAAGQKDLLFYTMDALGLSVNEDVTIQMAQDPSASFAWRIYSRLTMGSVRVQDKKIVNLRVADTM